MLGLFHPFVDELFGFAAAFLVLVFIRRLAGLMSIRAGHGIPTLGLGQRIQTLLARVTFGFAREFAARLPEIVGRRPVPATRAGKPA